MKTILVPTDFSKPAVNATEYAINLAKDLKANVLLLYVYNIPVMPYTDVPVVFPMPQELQQDAEQLLQNHVENFKKSTPDIEIGFKAIMGLPVSEIVEQAKHAEYVVMGMRGAGKLSEWLLGSVTTAVIKTIATPVFVIAEQATYRKPVKIALSTDYSLKPSTDVLEPLKRLIKLYNSTLLIVNIKTDKEVVIENIVAENRMEAAFSDVEHLYYYPERDDIVEGINAFVNSKKIDLLTIIPHQYKWLEEIFHKSNSKAIAFHSNVPVLALPEKR